MNMIAAAILLAVAPCAAMAETPQPIPFNQVKLTDGFWMPWLNLVRQSVLPHNLQYCESEGKIDNFRIVAGRLEGKHRGACWEDSDVYKVLEGAAYCLMLQPDPAIEKQCGDIIDLIAAAQQPDGYIDTYFTLVDPQNRWKDDSKHETYCAGHLIEAALAYEQATGKHTLLEVARRMADHMCEEFAPGKNENVPQHEEVELALVKLWRFTGEERYLELAKHFLERRGQPYKGKPEGRWGEVCQDHKPIREQDAIVGHAVRAMYLYCAVTDITALTGDEGYGRTLDRIWEDVTQRKMYVTGGIGDSSRRNEGFSAAYFLPNDTAYAETCASVGLVLWNQRMLMLHQDAKYADIIERCLYNTPLSCVSLDGHGFFYCNRLAGNDRRPPWQGCACCPTNMVRFLPAIAGYAYAHGTKSLYVNQYLPSETRVTLDGKPIAVKQETDYPWNGDIKLTFTADVPSEFALYLRIPAWCEGPQGEDDLYQIPGKPAHGAAVIKINGTPLGDIAIEKGYAVVRRAWNSGDTLELGLPMPVRRVRANAKIEADRGRIALQRGPVVFCLEAADNDRAVRSMAIPPDTAFNTEFQPNLLGGVMTIKGKALSRCADEPAPSAMEFTAIPYYAWSNRAPGYMQVWMPEDPALATPKPRPTIATQSAASTSFPNGDTPDAMNDQVEPKNSADTAIPRMTWWDRRGTAEWVEYAFDAPHTVRAVEVYWFDDTGSGSCRVPASWQVLYDEGGTWKPVAASGGYGVERDRFNRAGFAPVTTGKLRVEAQLQPNFSGGILEWRVLE